MAKLWFSSKQFDQHVTVFKNILSKNDQKKPSNKNRSLIQKYFQERGSQELHLMLHVANANSYFIPEINSKIDCLMKRMSNKKFIFFFGKKY